MIDTYRCYADLACTEREGIDYDRIVRLVPGARAAIIAPHGGKIEPHSEAIAAAIAGNEYSFYCFRGCKPSHNRTLHITSHRFDEPSCLDLLAEHDWVVAIHGCDDEGEQAFLGGLDTSLGADLASALEQRGIFTVTTGHDYPGTHPDNICNRGRTGTGVQIELTKAFREGPQVDALVAAVRSVLRARRAAGPANVRASCRERNPGE